MYPNLKAEMARLGLTGLELAKRIDINNTTFSQKLNCKSEFTMAEAKRIKKALGTEMSLDDLFEVRQ